MDRRLRLIFAAMCAVAMVVFWCRSVRAQSSRRLTTWSGCATRRSIAAYQVSQNSGSLVMS